MDMNRRKIIGGIALCAATSCAQDWRRGRGRSPLAKDDEERKILAVLEEMAAKGRTYLSVPMQDGRWLRVLTEAAAAKHVVEIGTSTGYSGLWFALALRRTGGKLTTFELDAQRAETARGHFRKAGVDSLITVVVGDAHENLRAVKGPVDVVFLDADKDGYIDYLEKSLPLVRTGGLILAHNVGMNGRYVEAITSNPALESVFYMDGCELGVTLKKL